MRGSKKLTWLANVHPRLPFCRDAALFRLTGGGQARLVCAEDENKERRNLYLDDTLLAEVYINDWSEFSCGFGGGYGDGLTKEPSCQAVQESINKGFEGLRHAEEYLAPYIALMESGLYVVADFEMFPVRKDGRKDYDYFWDVPEFCEELHFVHSFVGGGIQCMDTPLFLAPSQRAADMSPEKVECYRSRLQEGNAFPRAIALYLNGGVALLLDGHHKAAACAMEGQRVRALVIFPMEKINTKEVQSAVDGGVRLYLQRDVHPRLKPGRSAALCDGRDGIFGWVSCLEHWKTTRICASQMPKPEWGRVPDECRTEHFDDYPDAFELAQGCQMNPQTVRSMIEEDKKKGRGQHEHIAELRAYAHLFPESKWLSPTERTWLDRPEDQFEDWGFEVQLPDDEK